MRVGLLLPLLVLAACKGVNATYSTDYDASHIFGDPLDGVRGARVLCWPADDQGGSFRCVQDSVDRKIADQPVACWPDGLPARGPVGSVIVILPQDATPALRARAEALMDDLTRASPNAGRHVVIADTSWKGITGGVDLARELAALHERAKRWRETSADDGLFVTYEAIGESTPDVIVIPIDGTADRMLVLQGIRRNSIFTGGWEADSRDFLASAAVCDLPQRVSDDDKPVLMVFEIAVSDACGPATRRRAMRLAAKLLERGHTSVYLHTVEGSDIAEGVLRPGEIEPPYILAWQIERGSVIGTE
jgi:hypothetical protein